MRRFSREQKQLLYDIAQKHKPSLLDKILLPISTLTDSEIDDIILLLSDELCQTGLMPNDEPNNRGLEIESIIDIINNDYRYRSN